MIEVVLDVFLCHSPEDREVAATIAARLERGAEAKVWLDQCGSHSGGTIAATWETGLASAAILLLLSPQAVPTSLRRDDWESLLQHLGTNAEPPVGAVLLGDCPYPRLLERKRFFRWSDPPRDVLRSLERWIVGLHRQSERPACEPARLPWFQGRQQELDSLWQMLVDGAGSVAVANVEAGSGKTSLAQEFARSASAHFRDILWVECGDRWPVSIAGELASQLGATLDGSLDESFIRLGRLMGEHRLLLVLDDVTEATPILAPMEERTSVLMTTRSSGLRLPSRTHVLEIENGIGPKPLQPPSGSVDFKMCEAVSVCRPQGFPLSFAARIANVDASEAHAACERLVDRRWIDPLDSERSRYRRGAGSWAGGPLSTDDQALRRRHAETLSDTFHECRKHPTECKEILPELGAGFQWAIHSDWNLAVALAGRAFAFLSTQRRLTEAAEIYRKLREAARKRQDSKVVENCTWELSWIQDEGGEIRPLPVGGQLEFEFR